jgi:hypothetical protein
MQGQQLQRGHLQEQQGQAAHTLQLPCLSCPACLCLLLAQLQCCQLLLQMLLLGVHLLAGHMPGSAQQELQSASWAWSSSSSSSQASAVLRSKALHLDQWLASHCWSA